MQAPQPLKPPPPPRPLSSHPNLQHSHSSALVSASYSGISTTVSSSSSYPLTRRPTTASLTSVPAHLNRTIRSFSYSSQPQIPPPPSGLALGPTPDMLSQTTILPAAPLTRHPQYIQQTQQQLLASSDLPPSLKRAGTLVSPRQAPPFKFQHEISSSNFIPRMPVSHVDPTETTSRPNSAFVKSPSTIRPQEIGPATRSKSSAIPAAPPLPPPKPIVSPVERQQLSPSKEILDENRSVLNQSPSNNKGWQSGYASSSMPQIPLLGLAAQRCPTQPSLQMTGPSGCEEYRPVLPTHDQLKKLDSAYTSIEDMKAQDETIGKLADGVSEVTISGFKTTLMPIDQHQSVNSFPHEKDLEQVLNGERWVHSDLPCFPPNTPKSKTQSYPIWFEIEGCVNKTEYGFILKARRHSRQLLGMASKPTTVFIKMISRHSEAYKAVGKYVNPNHTELALLQTRKAKHLPEYIEHYWSDDYLVVVTKRHGLKKKGLGGVMSKMAGSGYYEVQWIYYFNQVA